MLSTQTMIIISVVVAVIVIFFIYKKEENFNLGNTFKDIGHDIRKGASDVGSGIKSVFENSATIKAPFDPVTLTINQGSGTNQTIPITTQQFLQGFPGGMNIAASCQACQPCPQCQICEVCPSPS